MHAQTHFVIFFVHIPILWLLSDGYGNAHRHRLKGPAGGVFYCFVVHSLLLLKFEDYFGVHRFLLPGLPFPTPGKQCGRRQGLNALLRYCPFGHRAALLPGHRQQVYYWDIDYIKNQQMALLHVE